MPKEQIRKRGKRKPKTDDSAIALHASTAPGYPEDNDVSAETTGEAGPSGIHPARAALLQGDYVPPAPAAAQDDSVNAGEGGEDAGWSRDPPVDAEFPFGVLDPDIKAYFRNVEDQIKDWEGTIAGAGEEREDRKMFLQSVLSELRGHELPAATDPDTSLVLERLLPSMGDWGRRVIGDSFAGSWEQLLRHRFGSHVVQTWFTLAADTLDREARNIWPPQQLFSSNAAGELPTMTTLFVNLLNSLSEPLPMLLTNPHASPPIRLLLLVISPNRPLPSLEGTNGDLVRSKKSNKFRKGHGVQGKSFLDDVPAQTQQDKGKGRAEEAIDRRVPTEVSTLRKTLRQDLMGKVSEVEWKSMGVNPVGSAAVQLLLELEAADSASLEAHSLLDIITEGLVPSLLSTSEPPTAQTYLSSLISSTTGTRLYEAILICSPPTIFEAIWTTYFVGKIGKLAAHPYANFVVAKGVSRLPEEGVREVTKECAMLSGGKPLIKSARTSVLQALVERSTQLQAAQIEVLNLIKFALDLPEGQTKDLVACLMTLKTHPVYNSLLNGEAPPPDVDDIPAEEKDLDAEESAAFAARHLAWQNRRTAKAKEGGLAPNMQGCLLLQSLVGLSGGANEVVLDSLIAQPLDSLLSYAKHPIASHLLDAVLDNPAAPIKYRRKLMLLFIGRYRELAEDKFGSRIAEKAWERADGYMKEKIAASLVHESTALFNSQYGKYFARKLNLQLYSRRPDEWKESMIGVKHHFAHQKEPPAAISAPLETLKPTPQTAESAVGDVADGQVGKKEKKNRRKEKDAIDELFAEKRSKKVKA